MHTGKKSDFLLQGSILAAASILVRLIGIVYRVPMANLLGTEGNGIYSVAFNFYNIVLILSSYGLPLAVSKMVAARTVKKEYRNAYRIFTHSLVFAVTVGGIAAGGVYFGADFLEKVVYGYPGIARPLRILAPTIFIFAILGVFRGYFQGKNTMVPTAFSQVFEQIINAVVSLVAAYGFMKAHSAADDIAAYGAAGGTLGTLIGALGALVFLIFVFILYRPVVSRQFQKDRSSNQEYSSDIYKVLFLTIIPIILSQTVYQISGTIDDILFGNVMMGKGMLDNVRKDLIGVYGSQYRLLINVPIAISSAVAASLVPSIVASVGKEKGLVKHKVRTSIKFNMVIAFPSAVGLAVLAHPIIKLLFPSLRNYSSLAGNMLVLGSAAVVFYALSTISSAVLQGINNMRLPVIHSAISLGIHIVLVFLLMQFTNWGVFALVVGNVTFPLVVCILNWIAVGKNLNYKQEIKTTFLIPFLCSLVMGAAAFGSYYVVNISLHSNLFAILVAVIVGVIIYFLALLVLKCFTKEELFDMPMGRTIGRIVIKMHLLQ